jgi:hypothetical protein
MDDPSPLTIITFLKMSESKEKSGKNTTSKILGKFLEQTELATNGEQAPFSSAFSWPSVG